MDTAGATQVLAALEVIYSPSSTNNDRLKSQTFLDRVRLQEESPFWGYEIVLNNSTNFIVKHFGLGLITHAMKHSWKDYNAEKRITLRKCIMELNYRVIDEDPRYIKEKLAYLWVEVAKRTWGEALKGGDPTEELLVESWVDMDSNLTELWGISQASRELALIIFRILFEDVFLLDDMIVLKRMTIIQPLCVMLVCPMDVFAAKYKFTEKWTLFKANQEGWFSVWINELNVALTEGNSTYVIRLLETLKTCLNWPLSEVIIKNDVLSTLLQCFLSSIPKAQSMALDSMHILLTRPYNNDEHYQLVINKVFDSMDILDKVYGDLQFNMEDGVDESKYPIIKKFVDMVSCLYVCVFKVDNDNGQIEKYMKLVLRATFHPSLIVSGLTLDLWCSCLRNDDFIPLLDRYVLRDLLQFAADALIYYEQIEDHVSKKFMDIDFQSKTDYQSFCSSYRKKIRDIIRLISCVRLDYTYDWLNDRLNTYFASPYGQEILSSTFLNTKVEPYLSALSQFMIIECFINGCIRWKIWYPSTENDYDTKLEDILQKLEILSNQLIALNIREPSLLKKLVQNFALFLTMLKDNVLFMLLEKIITTATLDYPGIDLDELNEKSEAVRELRYACGIELNRMALLMPESLKAIYPDLESVVARIMPNLSYHEKISFESFLLTIILKSSLEGKEERFSAIVDPELMAWSDKGTVVGLSDIPWFMERLGVVQIAEYFQKRGINENSNLLDIPIDEEGKKLKNDLSKRWQTLFPVRATRMFIHYSMQSVKKDEEFKMLQDLWRPRIVPILPYIMRLLYQLTAYHDPDSWVDLPVVVQSFVKYSTVERFWEAGASNKSKDEFIDEHMKAMQTLRDFADSVGHIVRYTREYTLLVISAISSLGSVFFEIDEVPDMLLDSIAIYKPGTSIISPGVSTHGWKHVLNVAIRPILKNCPESCSAKFMPAFLPKLFKTLDILLCEKWSGIMNDNDSSAGPRDDDEVTEEILEENLLRQLTTVVVLMLLDCIGQVGPNSKQKLNTHQVKMRKIIFTDMNTLASFLKLLNHLISFKDSKCSFNAMLIMKSCLADVLIKDESVDQFFSFEVMKTLLHTLVSQNTYRDSFYEGMYIFTVLFLTLCREYTSTREYLFELSHGYDIDSLYDNLRKVENYKNQRALMIDFFDHVKRANGSVDDTEDSHGAVERKRQEKREANLRRVNEKLIQKHKDPSDLLDDPATENGAFANLFESA
ncbi:karyopherin MSN5 KNAG_0B04410 [Huiozyma naganishii CBS 8797]|uniref:Exportin-5 C-terminal domain-containing protein n=1 Tax=Huiozyma naganishii (strain ATCC MYA-139 / BCRC 22969 / CBS 8797 / KCTC 17520 / NBRC 10181 / NCYC 3082 / Yp74L-3) TaxID=1071383 RepID=J7R231_HUIN7|nr:hypothetical protein KNAG_0B04410 [Kazachstania naganishii CBS 8797]CCK68875.1 hypothetical protein KNAG_0B04410 [Kazachstania naganishii CBS 8797]